MSLVLSFGDHGLSYLGGAADACYFWPQYYTFDGASMKYAVEILTLIPGGPEVLVDQQLVERLPFIYASPGEARSAGKTYLEKLGVDRELVAVRVVDDNDEVVEE